MTTTSIRFLGLLILACSLFNQSFSQQRISAEALEVKKPQRCQAALKTSGLDTLGMDTLTTFFDRATGYYFLTAGSQGYVLGTNDFTTEVGQLYDPVGSLIEVTDLMVYFVHKEYVGTTSDSISANAWSVDGDTLPTSLLASAKYAVEDLDTSGFATVIPLNVASPTSGQFLVSIDYDPATIQDTVVLYSTNPTNSGGGPDGLGERRVRQKTTLGWSAAEDLWDIAGNAYNADVLIIPIINCLPPTGIESGVNAGGLILRTHYPNPADKSLTISYALDKESSVIIRVFDTAGRIIYETTSLSPGKGEHGYTLNTEQMSSGTYYYTVTAGRARIGSKFIISR